MIPTTVHYRCPRCRANLTAAATRSGSSVVCPTCFGPMVVPDPVVAAPNRLPIALAIEVPPPPGPGRPAPEPAPFVPEPPDEAEPIEPEAPEFPEATVPWARLRWAAGVAGIGLIAAMGLILALDRPRGESRLGGRPAGPARLASHAPEPAPAPARPRPAARDKPQPAPVVISVSRPVPAVAIDLAPRREPDRPVGARVASTGPDPAPRAPRPAAAPAPAPAAQAVGPIKVRWRAADQEALREELAAVPELALNPRLAESMFPQQVRPGFAGVPSRPAVTVGPFGTAFTFGPSPAPKAQAHHRTRHPQKAAPLGAASTEPEHARQPERIAAAQPELAALPWRMGRDCQLAREPAEELQLRSRAMRVVLQSAILDGNPGPDTAVLRAALVGGAAADPQAILAGGAEGDPRADLRAAILARSINARATAAASRPPVGRPGVPGPTNLSWVDPAAIPALMQLLMAERTTTREVLVAVLAEIPGPMATSALAKLAIFDLAPEVRDRAVRALRSRSAAAYRPILLEGFRYPWPPVADHAADALVTLGDHAAVPDLAELLEEPDPRGPTPGLRRGKTVPLIRTLVRVNHLRNCLLCHAPSTDPTTDLVRGRIPSEGQPLPPPVQYYGDGMPGRFVRAEVTYLRQDFSVNQPVEDAAPWPSHQRFDYLVAERPATSREREQARIRASSGTYPQREAVRFALRELTGRDDPAPGQDAPAAPPAD